MTTKKVVTAVEQGKFLDILKEMGVPYTEQTGFIRVEGPKGRRIYVARTKGVRRVDISGFNLEAGAVALDKDEAPTGRVKQQLDFTQDEAHILSTFRKAVKHMMSLPPSETARRLRDEPPALEGSKEAAPSADTTSGALGKKKAKSKRIAPVPPTLRPRPSA